MHIEIIFSCVQNNEKVVLVVARKKTFAQATSTAISAEDDEVDGPLPGPQSHPGN